ncbi:hypothetical protein RSJ42_03005 [Methanosarcina hadiensis]|uniref:hypothetical protein n=1 Tax=Methanosarcina hadiensis TaxID=3078083 RepID=UPI00397772BB
MLETPIVASEGSLELIPGAALPEKTLSNRDFYTIFLFEYHDIYSLREKERQRRS